MQVQVWPHLVAPSIPSLSLLAGKEFDPWLVANELDDSLPDDFGFLTVPPDRLVDELVNSTVLAFKVAFCCQQADFDVAFRPMPDPPMDGEGISIGVDDPVFGIVRVARFYPDECDRPVGESPGFDHFLCFKDLREGRPKEQGTVLVCNFIH